VTASVTADQRFFVIRKFGAMPVFSELHSMIQTTDATFEFVHICPMVQCSNVRTCASITYARLDGPGRVRPDGIVFRFPLKKNAAQHLGLGTTCK
jgi:hypothetical protein